MTYIDYYKILGIEKTATPSDIKSAYRKLARKYHPDLNPNDKNAKANFQSINEANSVLSDPANRKKYDEQGRDWQHDSNFENKKQYQESNSNYSDQEFSDFFESMFGGAANANRSNKVRFRGEDYHAELHLNLIDTYKSHQQTLKVKGENIRITIPAGIENGQTIKIYGHGGQGVKGGPNGDLYITFSIIDHPVFKRLGNNIYANVELNLFTAVLGGEFTMETLDGKVKLNVKPETQNGSKIKLTGKGFPIYKNEGQFGDLIITFAIKIPTNLNVKQKALFLELSKL